MAGIYIQTRIMNLEHILPGYVVMIIKFESYYSVDRDAGTDHELNLHN